MALEAVFKLLTMLFQVIGQTKPLDSQHEHPVNGPLQFLVSTGVLIDFAHSLFTVPQVEGLFLINLDERSLPGTEGRTLMDIAEQCIACSIIESVRDNQFDPA